MCGICTLPTTHANTISTISMVSLFLMVFWTFVWAWWIVTKINIENYFVNKFQSIRKARRVSFGYSVRQTLVSNRKYQIVLLLLFVSVGALLLAAFIDRQDFISEELATVELLNMAPNPDTEFLHTELLQADKI